MRVEVNIEKKYFFTIVALILIFGCAFFAYGTMISGSFKPNPGHDLSEIGGPICQNGQALTRNSAGWDCINVSNSKNAAGFSNYAEFNFYYAVMSNGSLFYSSNGQYKWIVPENVTKIMVELWGGGGGGNYGGCIGSAIGGIGGGGGGYGQAVRSVLSNSQQTIIVGSGGAANGGDGGTSWFANLNASGGLGNGLGGTSNAPIYINGDSGEYGSEIERGKGGDSPRGGPSQQIPGGGGYGAKPGSNYGGCGSGPSGGAGASGRVIVWW